MSSIADAGVRLKAFREGVGLSQRGLARALREFSRGHISTTQGYVHKLELGKFERGPSLHFALWLEAFQRNWLKEKRSKKNGFKVIHPRDWLLDELVE